MSKFKKITSIKKLKLIANQIRKDIILMLSKSSSGHTGGALGMVEVFTSLYFNIMKHDPKKPKWNERDYFILSNGHICPGLYATLANCGYFSKKEYGGLRKLGGKLQGHPHRGSLSGLETSSGPLGSGLSQAAGIALGLKMDKKKNRVYCMTSDGEHDSGNTYEAMMFAAKYKLDNLCSIIDRNNIQIDGFTKDIMPIKPLRKKYEAFNWHVIEVNGNDIAKVIWALDRSKQFKKKPVCIVAHSVLGKGVSFMENVPDWHGKPPKGDEVIDAIRELDERRLKILGDRR